MLSREFLKGKIMLLNERKIVLSILSYALDKGLSVSVNDGDGLFIWNSEGFLNVKSMEKHMEKRKEDTLDYSTDINEIFEALDTTGDDYIFFHDADKKSLGYYWFIYGNGNEGLDVVSDSSMTNLIDEIDLHIQDLKL